MKHATTVPVVIVLAHDDVDVDEIPCLELLVAGNPMARNMIYRDAGRTRESNVQASRMSLQVVENVTHAFVIQLTSRNASFNEGSNVLQDFGCEPTSLPHTLD
jgi:hypothetical protein